MHKAFISLYRHLSAQWMAILLFLPLLMYCIVQAWDLRFLQDDAFISFRYAQNFALGHGLVFNVSERLEGYSNFLYTLLMAIPHGAGWNVEDFSNAMNMGFWLLGLGFVYGISRRGLGLSVAASLAVCVLLASNASYALYATGGLETAMVLGLILFCLWSFVRANETSNTSSAWYVLASIAGAAAMLTRLDAFIPLSLIFFFQLLLMCHRQHQIAGANGVLFYRPVIVKSLQALLPIAVILLIYMGWKLFYYGDVLPNTYYIKVGNAEADMAIRNLEKGRLYLAGFVNSYAIWPAAILGLFLVSRADQILLRIKPTVQIPQLLQQKSCLALISLACLMIWSIYIVRVGGDFMEYRFALMLLPFTCVLIAAVLTLAGISNATQVFVLLLLAGASFQNNLSEGGRPKGVEGRGSLWAHVYHPAHDWKGIGQALHKNMPANVRIATTAAGAIPYFSGLYTLDMLGLNNAWVAKHGIDNPGMPGHQRITSFQYMLDSNIDFIIAHPQMLHRSSAVSADQLGIAKIKRRFWLHHRMSDRAFSNLLQTAQLLRMPVNKDYDVLMIWLPGANQGLADHIHRQLKRHRRWKLYSLQEHTNIMHKSYRQLQQVKAVGSFWKARGNTVIAAGAALQVALDDAAVSHRLQLSLDHNDSYELTTYSRSASGQLELLERISVLAKLRAGGGLSWHEVNLSNKNINVIRLQGSGGDGLYSFGHLRFLPDSE